ncbi:MAG: Gfo/Idh/MocA family oxidoreductase [Clostridia bacterium]
MYGSLGVAVIGCGGISQIHLTELSKIPQAQVRAVCDIRQDRLQAAMDAWHVPGDTDYHALLARPDVDVVHICTPHFLHAPIALDALAAGKWVLTEKPMAGSLADARRMIEAANGRLGVVFQNRYNGSVRMLKEMLDSGALGAIRTMRASVCWHRAGAYYTESGWRGKWATECGGSLINQALHTVDLMQWLGGPIEAVRGSVTTDLLADIIEVEDNTHAVIKFRSGVIGLLHTSNNYGVNAPIELEVVCEGGTLRLYGDSLLRMYEDGRIETLCSPAQTPAEGQIYWGVSHGRLIADFYACIAEDRPFWLDGRAGYPALWVVKSIYASSAGAGWVQAEA